MTIPFALPIGRRRLVLSLDLLPASAASRPDRAGFRISRTPPTPSWPASTAAPSR